MWYTWFSFSWYLACLVFSELSGFVVWCLPLIWNVLSHYYHPNSSVLFSLLSPNIPIICMLYILQKLHSSYTWFHSFFFTLHFSFCSFYWCVSKFPDSFPGCVQSADKPTKDILPLFYRVFDSQHFLLLLRVSVSLFTLLICSFMLPTFPLKPLTY